MKKRKSPRDTTEKTGARAICFLFLFFLSNDTPTPTPTPTHTHSLTLTHSLSVSFSIVESVEMMRDVIDSDTVFGVRTLFCFGLLNILYGLVYRYHLHNNIIKVSVVERKRKIWYTEGKKRVWPLHFQLHCHWTYEQKEEEEEGEAGNKRHTIVLNLFFYFLCPVLYIFIYNVMNKSSKHIWFRFFVVVVVVYIIHSSGISLFLFTLSLIVTDWLISLWLMYIVYLFCH